MSKDGLRISFVLIFLNTFSNFFFLKFCIDNRNSSLKHRFDTLPEEQLRDKNSFENKNIPIRSIKAANMRIRKARLLFWLSLPTTFYKKKISSFCTYICLKNPPSNLFPYQKIFSLYRLLYA